MNHSFRHSTLMQDILAGNLLWASLLRESSQHVSFFQVVWDLVELIQSGQFKEKEAMELGLSEQRNPARDMSIVR